MFRYCIFKDKNETKEIEKLEYFQKSNLNWIIKDTTEIKNEFEITTKELPNRIFKSLNIPKAKSKVLSSYKIAIKDTTTSEHKTIYVIKIVESSMTSKFDTKTNSWVKENSYGRRYQFYDQSGYFIGVRKY